MNETPNGNAHAAATLRAFAQQDEERRAYLNRRCLELRWMDEREAASATGGKIRGKHWVAAGMCLRCGAKEISTKNGAGVCRDCYDRLGKAQRESYRSRWREQRGRAE